MSHTDPIADMLTRIRNAVLRGQSAVLIPASKLKLEIARVMKQEGYINSYQLSETEDKGTLELVLRYNGKTCFIKSLDRVSKPGKRIYWGTEELHKVKRSNKVYVLTTPNGVITATEALKKKCGGEVLCCIE